MSEPKQDLNRTQLEGHYKKFMDRQYIGSHDLMLDDGTYTTKTVTIDGIFSRQIYNPGSRSHETCMVASFEGAKKDFIVNVTNQNAIEDIAKTPMAQDWVGTKIKLVVEQVSVKGSKQPALRVKVP